MTAKIFLKTLVIGLTLWSTQSFGSDQQVLCKELLTRWEALSEPDFIASKKLMIDEVYSGTMSKEAESVRQLLRADEVEVPQKISSLIDPKVYSSLQHQMKSAYLVANLKEGVIHPRAGEGNPLYFHEGLYLELHTHSNPKPFAWGDVELHFKFTLLDRSDYYISSAWSHGEYWPDSASPAVNKGRVQHLIEKVIPTTNQNEVVFVNPIELSALEKIIVPEGKKKSLIENLKKEQIKNPTEKTWEDLIKEQKTQSNQKSKK